MSFSSRGLPSVVRSSLAIAGAVIASVGWTPDLMGQVLSPSVNVTVRPGRDGPLFGIGRSSRPEMRIPASFALYGLARCPNAATELEFEITLSREMRLHMPIDAVRDSLPTERYWVTLLQESPKLWWQPLHLDSALAAINISGGDKLTFDGVPYRFTSVSSVGTGLEFRWQAADRDGPPLVVLAPFWSSLAHADSQPPPYGTRIYQDTDSDLRITSPATVCNP